jgi:hypothetical protein
LDFTLSLLVVQTPPPVPVALIDVLKVKVDPVGCPVEVKVLLNDACVFPPTTNTVPLGNVQVAVQVTVPWTPFAVMEETIPPT